ncbi:Cell division protein FtsN [Candidatus Palibaumannia cicadellinicola]|uniref:Cell division protein FtsN n=1 Tax=Candidatus Palibaumannia cicadellinicola TaxID=186490 RepID=A0A088NA87_9GAMM|nr:Cell division protein FtsN [Candidatus Baumannia cicadellinicola]
MDKIIVAQIDYIDRVSSTRHKKNHRKKNFFTMILLLVLIAFVSGINFFRVHNKSDKSVMVPIIKKHTGNGLPPKPKERWRYISELENR